MKRTGLSVYRLITAFVFFIVLFMGLYWVKLHESILKQEHWLLLKDVVQVQAAAIERRVSRALSATHFLSLEVQLHGGVMDDFDSYAKHILHTIEGVSNLQLAPGGVIKQIYPLAGNEKAIGHNILRDDPRRAEAHLAIQEQRLTLAGPFELVQGGVAVIGRNPVFLQQGHGEPGAGQQFWGFVSALIYLEDLLAMTELAELESKGYHYQLTRLHPDSGENQIIAASQKVLEDQAFSSLIEVPNATWTLSISHPMTAYQQQLIQGYIASLLIAIAAAIACIYVQRQPEKLRRVVKEKTKELEYLAYYDPLTGLANRRLLLEHLNKRCQQGEQHSECSALLFLDLDDFKCVNDNRGHDVGDYLLTEVSARLKQGVDKKDIVARLGGDEFAILLRGVESYEQIASIAQQLIYSVQQPVMHSDEACRVSVSIGIARIPRDASSVNEALKCADLAMYQAKNEGKGHFCFFSPELLSHFNELSSCDLDSPECLNESCNHNDRSAQIRIAQ